MNRAEKHPTSAASAILLPTLPQPPAVDVEPLWTLHLGGEDQRADALLTCLPAIKPTADVTSAPYTGPSDARSLGPQGIRVRPTTMETS